MNIETVKTQLRSLRLWAASREIEQVLLQHKKAVNLDWFSDLLTRELDARKQNALKLRFKQAGFPESVSLETFDFGFNHAIKGRRHARSVLQARALLPTLDHRRLGRRLHEPRDRRRGLRSH